MNKIIIALLLSFTFSTHANTMSGAMLGSAYPSAFNNSGNVDLGGGFASTGCTVDPATGDLSCSGDYAMGGQDLKTTATGGADDIRLLPASVTDTGLTITEAGAILIKKVVTTHGACAAAGDRGRMEMYDDASDHVSLCVCEQTAAATYAWKALSSTGVC